MAKTWTSRAERIKRLLDLLARADVEAMLPGNRGGPSARLARIYAVNEWVAELRSLGALPADYVPKDREP